MLKRLIDFFARQSQIASGQTTEPEQKMREPKEVVAPELRRKALAAFMELACRQLDAAERKRLRARALKAFDQPESDVGEAEECDAFFHAVLEDDGQRRGQWLLIQVDWKAWDEIDWQVNELLNTRGLADCWSWTPQAKEDMSVMRGLQALETWLDERQLTLLHLDADADAYYALIVEQSVLAQALSLAHTAGLKAMHHQDFVSAQS